MVSLLGIGTAFLDKGDEKSFVAENCAMVPVEWVARRLATGSYLKRHPGVAEGTRFYPPKVETFFKVSRSIPNYTRKFQLICTEVTYRE